MWVNLFREFDLKSKSNNFFKRLQPITCIMILLFTLSITLYLNNIPFNYLPFLIGWIFIAISFLYFRIFPLSWEEMTMYEKEAYRYINKLPIDWEPK